MNLIEVALLQAAMDLSKKSDIAFTARKLLEASIDHEREYLAVIDRLTTGGLMRREAPGMYRTTTEGQARLNLAVAHMSRIANIVRYGTPF